METSEIDETIERLKQNVVDVTVTINGEVRHLKVPPAYRLIDILRKNLNLTGTKVSCEIGRCGACSVLLNGNVVTSCLVMAYQVNNTSIETIESVSSEQLHPLQVAFLEEGALQCGYCTPGMVISLMSLLDQGGNPTEEEVKNHLSGNLCRCTGYNGILRAVEKYKKQCSEETNS
ncbi:xanthine dehydrogenase E subunit [Metabacillus crassostreae]|uniref:(2Fe-2S)-binding protein n=1 Tax=Metabacillus crassostreae TaxID=929098 RepID=UPI00195C718B|nr:(2Fe-2S)-binding protein [Metabacillus crassostreae]MBM7603651.1 xanthine dehydrogenase E subunit [Metabacillus crassostreae]